MNAFPNEKINIEIQIAMKQLSKLPIIFRFSGTKICL